MSGFTARLSEDLEPRTELRAAIDRASESLREMVERNDYRDVTAMWALEPKPVEGRILSLGLFGVDSIVHDTFRPEELTGPNAWFKLSQLYRRLLMERVRRSVERLGDQEAPLAGVGAEG